ncbi:MAG: hypothetical protein ACOC5M_03330 [Chloroflexota bacterium]
MEEYFRLCTEGASDDAIARVMGDGGFDLVDVDEDGAKFDQGGRGYEANLEAVKDLRSEIGLSEGRPMARYYDISYEDGPTPETVVGRASWALLDDDGHVAAQGAARWVATPTGIVETAFVA